jgi:hypothetical protein
MKLAARLVWVLLLGATGALGASGPRTFKTPEDAVSALATAAKASDSDALLDVLGPDARQLLQSGDEVADRAQRESFLRQFDQSSQLVSPSPDRRVLEVGSERWPFPIPLVRTSKGWSFDVKAGQEEIISRRIGRNELWAIQASLAYVDAQREYYIRNPEGTGLLHYAKQINSTPGKRDGLYWEVKPGEQPSPLGPLFASASAEGYSFRSGEPAPYHGYSFRILTRQGPNARGGSYDYLAHDELFGGFALVAYPARYGNSGVMTFIVNHDGVVFQKDLGPRTTELARSMKAFDPGPGWKRVNQTLPPGS